MSSSSPRLEACYYAPGDDSLWARYANVLEYTSGRQCQDWERRIAKFEPTERLRSPIHNASHVANTYKLDHWVERLNECEDGTRLALLDVDVAVLRPLDSVWELEFDLAYTTKVRPPYEFNLGVMFVRVSPVVRAFFAAWREWNRELLLNPGPNHIEWRLTYGGVNQYSFKRLMNAGALEGLRVATLPCREWNCEESEWIAFDPAVTRVVHFKGMLRRAILRMCMITQELRPLVDLWGRLEREAQVDRRAKARAS